MTMAFSTGEVTAILIGLGNIGAWGKLIYDARKNGRNGAAAELESRMETFRAENHSDHQKMSDDITKLSVSVASAAGAAATAAAAAATVAAGKRKR